MLEMYSNLKMSLATPCNQQIDSFTESDERQSYLFLQNSSFLEK